MSSQLFIRWAIVAAVAAGVVYCLLPFLAYVSLGGIFAIILFPFKSYLVEKKWSEWAATSFVVALATVLVLVPVGLLLVAGARSLLAQIPQAYRILDGDGWSQMFARIPFDELAISVGSILPFDVMELKATLIDMAAALGDRLTKILGTLLARIPTGLLSSLFFIVSLFFFTLHGSEVVRLAYTHSPWTPTKTEDLLKAFRLLCRSLVVAMLITGLAQALIFSIGYSIAGLEGTLVVSFAVFVMSFIPLLGTAPVTFGLAIYHLLSETPSVGLILTVAAFLTGILDNLVRPLVLRAGAQMDPFIAFTAVIGGLIGFGFPGLFLGPILFGILIHLFRTGEMVPSKKRAKNELLTEDLKLTDK
ncbi:MAG: hypothetical protein COT74_10285 [Bdellovibrionales bacterium CG10_big_fil_rev_8_21_14_0_10_45_34]|nr:MAG: hypothetical protein COT74_10285 [Bdellovibrionales bacterium CG10_big_fil_rev_8_21_14_0_10_45_34]